LLEWSVRPGIGTFLEKYLLSILILMMMMKMTRDDVTPSPAAEATLSDARVSCDVGLRRASLMTSSMTSSSSSSWQCRVLLRMSLIINDVIVTRSVTACVIVDTDFRRRTLPVSLLAALLCRQVDVPTSRCLQWSRPVYLTRHRPAVYVCMYI